MYNAQQAVIEELQYYFVVEQVMPDGSTQVALSSYAPFRDDRTTVSFDSEEDAALYLLERVRGGAVASFNDIENARAIIRGDMPLFLYEEKQQDGMLQLSLHDRLPPEGARVVVFGARSPRLVARLLLRRLSESGRVRASEETIERARAILYER
jgi:hypothetical protein